MSEGGDENHHVTATPVHIERFVPSGEPSLLDDAPGWNVDGRLNTNDEDFLGPICWKCRGTGTKAATLKRGKQLNADSQVETGLEKLSFNSMPACPVCQGRGRLAPKRADVEGTSKPGVITRGRNRPTNWHPSGPTPVAMMARTLGTDLVKRATFEREDVVVPLELATEIDDAGWLPQAGEELCNLVGSWRILQRVGSHRWTTDDLCTAFVATLQLDYFVSALMEKPSSLSPTMRYLDLGTGNASVLQMTSWAILRDGRFNLCATGIEARKEAVELARRSATFNFGCVATDESSCRIINGDFRDQTLDESFDLITGTPPYFRVDFVIDRNEQAVTSAIINQGGMPTAKQSAPARCEFRGGIEAYCEAAGRLLHPGHGKFVVCENWLNHDRVINAAEQIGLQITYRLDVEGREGRGTLFCVYVMARTRLNDCPCEIQTIAVRDAKGDWTGAYKRRVLKTMAIPTP
jgi:tRNA1(Val) A37 N6-methylase TrmN6